MAVAPEISRQHLREELALAQEIARTYDWKIEPDYEKLVVVVTMNAHTGDTFIVEAKCDDYKELPAFFEFIDSKTGERGTPRAYPKTTDSFFHGSGPCICAPFNRKAYKAVVQTGPHQDWALGEWQSSTANNVQWANYTKLGDMFGLIYTRVSRPDLFKGRMA